MAREDRVLMSVEELRRLHVIHQVMEERLDGSLRITHQGQRLRYLQDRWG